MDPETKKLVDEIGRGYTELQQTLTQKAEQAAAGRPWLGLEAQEDSEGIHRAGAAAAAMPTGPTTAEKAATEARVASS